MRKLLLILPLLVFVAGCPVTQSQDTPVPADELVNPKTGREYWLYVPSTYSKDKTWPLVITLHGTHGWDSSRAQIKEWKKLAEEKSFIVAAPHLRGVQGILPVIKSWWYEDLAGDERHVLAVMDEICSEYNIDKNRVLLTGFSAGGYPLYYVGLRHPRRFSMLIARACNSDIGIFEDLKMNDDIRKMPILIFWGKDDLSEISKQSWQAFAWLRRHKCYQTEIERIKGGHLRRPDLAYRLWLKRMSKTAPH